MRALTRPHRGGDEHEEVRQQRDCRGKLEHTAISARGHNGLLLRELHPIRNELGPAMEPAGVHRPQPRLHMRHRFVLHLPHEQWHRQEHQQATEQLRGNLECCHSAGPSSAPGMRAFGPHSSGLGTPGGNIRRRPGDERSECRS